MKNPFHVKPIGKARGNALRADSLFAPSLVASIAIHLSIFILVATLNFRTRLTMPDRIPVTLLETSQQQQEQTPPRELPRPIEKRKPEPQPAVKPQTFAKASAVPAKPKDEPIKPAESSALPAPIQPLAPERPAEANGGAPAGASVFSLDGQTAVAPGPGSGGGGGTSVARLGRGSGAPGLPVPSGPLRTNREAKAIQTVRAVYPPMALRMGMESDVTLRIEVDPAGNVTKAEIVKSGGASFDEEALKAVTQSRFAPAERDGRGVAAEFTYIYRFRLQR